MIELTTTNIVVLALMFGAAGTLGFVLGCLRAAKMDREEERIYNEEMMARYKCAREAATSPGADM